MTQTVQDTTQKLIDLLPENEEYYRLDELRSWGFPPFIAQRIKVELERNMAESMILPQTDWANVKSDAVQHAWQQFVQAIRAEARLPASYARAVIETAVVDVVDMLTEPRKNIPDVIFGGNKVLDFAELSERIEAVVVYSHFAALLPRYMQKKDMERLSKVRCMQVISQADRKLTANYSPLNWAQTLDPLFKLLDDTIDPSLLRLFFEDKDRSQLAEVFDRRDETLSRAEFIEILSSPDLIEGQSHEQIETEKRAVQTSEEPPEKEEVSASFTGSDTEKKEASDLSAADQDDREKAGRVEEELEEQNGFDGTVPAKSRDEQSTEGSEEEQSANEDNVELDDQYTGAPIAINGNGSNSINAAFGGAGQTDEEDFTEETEASSASLKESDDADEESVDPIWMHFMSEEDKSAVASEEEPEELSKSEFDRADLPEEEAEEDSDEEPIIDLTEDDSEADKQADELIEYLSENRDYFAKSIFDGSEQAYEEAVQKIASFDDWRKASKYIQNDIFRRNLVDMYSESAVNFTDRLQDYFLEKEN